MADVVAVHDRHLGRATELASQIHAQAYGELDAMLKREHLDALSICTPPWLHAPQALQALEADVHVLVEKPMAMSAEECNGMCDAAARRGRKLCVAHNFLYSRAVRRVRERHEAGHTGRIESVVGFQMSTPRRRLPDWYDALPGQLFFDEAPHLVYLTRHFLGPAEPRLLRADAFQGSAEDIQRTQNVVSVLRGESGLGVLSMTFNASRAEWGFVVVGSKESYIVDLFRDQVLLLGEGGAHTPREVLAQTAGGLSQAITGAAKSGTLYATGRLLYGHGELVNAFLTSIIQDGAVPVPGSEGMRTISVIESICRMAELTPMVRA